MTSSHIPSLISPVSMFIVWFIIPVYIAHSACVYIPYSCFPLLSRVRLVLLVHQVMSPALCLHSRRDCWRQLALLSPQPATNLDSTCAWPAPCSYDRHDHRVEGAKAEVI